MAGIEYLNPSDEGIEKFRGRLPGLFKSLYYACGKQYREATHSGCSNANVCEKDRVGFCVGMQKSAWAQCTNCQCINRNTNLIAGPRHVRAAS